jgi:putative oxidoreductase
MKTFSFVLLRVSVGLLILYWGIDKIVDVDHAVAVSDSFYLGLFSVPILLQVWGGFQALIGLFTILGLYRVVAYPLVIAMNTVSMLGVWRSIVDPWGWFLEGTNVLFFPSLTIFAASLLLWAMRHEEPLALDRRRGR